MQNAGCYYITVIEDTRKQEIIGAASLITEFKIIHSCGLRGRLEDVVVNSTYRGKQLGKLYGFFFVQRNSIFTIFFFFVGLC